MDTEGATLLSEATAMEGATLLSEATATEGAMLLSEATATEGAMLLSPLQAAMHPSVMAAMVGAKPRATDPSVTTAMEEQVEATLVSLVQGVMLLL
jgi:hypothetical protein